MKRKTSLRRAILPPLTLRIPLREQAPITLPAQPDFCGGVRQVRRRYAHLDSGRGRCGVVKHTNKRQYIAIMPGDYRGTVYVSRTAPGSLTVRDR